MKTLLLLWKALENCLQGVKNKLYDEIAFQIELAFAVILITASMLLPVSLIVSLLLILSVLIVLFIELLETTVNRIYTIQNALSAKEKDAGRKCF